MSFHSVETLKVKPCFDMELLLLNSRESRLEGRVMDELLEKWACWMPWLYAKRIIIGTDSYLAVWLDEKAEAEVDALWEQRPSKGFLYNALAQTLCMAALCELLPEAAEKGCVPVPAPCPQLLIALEMEGLSENAPADGLGIKRRYAVVTCYPARKGCADCGLLSQCPGKASAN